MAPLSLPDTFQAPSRPPSNMFQTTSKHVPDTLQIANVVSVAVRAMFENHLYKFTTKTYRQRAGGPIGLRGTCAVARLLMSHFDVEWMGRVELLKFTVWECMRYMDDGRVILPAFKHGWRWCEEEGEIKYCKAWEEEDKTLSPTEVTRRIVGGTLSGIHQCLKFTTETSEDFGDGWLPTLDVKLRMSDTNQVEHHFYEKPTNSNVSVQFRSAMEENSKVRGLGNELVRRFLNTSEELLGDEAKTLIDSYAEKLLTSGYKRDQVVRIVVSGIRCYRARVMRCEREGRKLYRTAAQSSTTRRRKKLLGKLEWYKGRRQQVRRRMQGRNHQAEKPTPE